MLFKIESLNFQHLIETEFCERLKNIQLIQLIQTIVIFISSVTCLIELKFWEVSRSSYGNKCWKFQLSILKNKKVLFLQKYFLSRSQHQNKKALFTDPIFSDDFGYHHYRSELHISLKIFGSEIVQNSQKQFFFSICLIANILKFLTANTFEFWKDSSIHCFDKFFG